MSLKRCNMLGRGVQSVHINPLPAPDPQPFAEHLMVFCSIMTHRLVLYQGGPALQIYALQANG